MSSTHRKRIRVKHDGNFDWRTRRCTFSFLLGHACSKAKDLMFGEDKTIGDISKVGHPGFGRCGLALQEISSRSRRCCFYLSCSTSSAISCTLKNFRFDFTWYLAT
eukprot:6175097-Pleurochrysis_carterae.AAC.6